MAAAFADEQVMGAKGTFRTEQTGFVPRFVQAEYEDRYDHMRRLAGSTLSTTTPPATAATCFLANGGFDVHFAACDDQELSFRLAEKGYRLVFVPPAVVTHLHDTCLQSMYDAKYAQGFWKAPLTHLHPERMVQDTHTPQVLKLQIVLASLMRCTASPLAVGPLVAVARLAVGGRTGAGWLFLLPRRARF